MWWKHLAERGRTDLSVDQRQALFIAGDDASAKRIVAALIEQIGFACVDTGTLKDGGRLQAVGSPLYNSPMTGVQARTAIDALQGASTSRDGAVKAELDRLTREFFKAVSFEAGETPPYENIHALFIEPGPTPPRCSSSRAGARCRCSPGPTC